MSDGYFKGALVLCVFASLLLSVAHPRFKSVTNICAGILVSFAIMSPLVVIIRDFNIDDVLDGVIGDADIGDMTDNAVELAFEEGTAEYIASRLGVDPSLVSVNVDGFDMESMKADRVYVTLRGAAITADYKRLEKEIEDRLTKGGKCEVSVSFG